MLRLFRRHPYLIGFCLLSAAFSGPGQTYFVSIYIPALREELGLSRSLVAALYSAATLLAAALVPAVGRRLDRDSPKTVATALGFGVAAGCALLGGAQGPLGLFAAFACLRLFGQSGLAILAVTTAARSFSKSRGKALGLTSMGFPAAEMLFPFAAAVMLPAAGWRATSLAVACLVLLAYVPPARFLIARGKKESAAGENEDSRRSDASPADRTLPEVLRSPLFYCCLAVMFVPPFMFTGVLFHQGTLFKTKGWPAAALAPALFCFGLCRALLALGIGPVIDRLGARRLFGANLLAAAAGMAVLIAGESPAAAALALALFGATVGIGGPVRSALFAETFGTKHLGAINGVGTSFVVFATAAAPVAFGVALDSGTEFSRLLAHGIALALACFAAGRLGLGLTSPPAALRSSLLEPRA